MSQLIITNGDSAADLLREAGIEGTVLPWRDVLHEGPVPDTATEAELREIRARHLADGVVHSRAGVLSDMAARDAHLDAHEDYERIELWFEHDLYDQLQLLQILSMLDARQRVDGVVLVQAPTYLGTQQANSILRFKELELPVSETMMSRVAGIWTAYRQTSPEDFADAAKDPIGGYLFLRQALKRALEELPRHDNGVSRTERQILYSINRGVAKPGPLFARVLNMEDAAFLGDWSFFSILSGLAKCDEPLLTGLPERFVPGLLQDDTRRKAFITSDLYLTELGQAVLAGEADHAEHNRIDRWLGGTHVTNDHLWRWDDGAEALIAPPG